jgi:hypothetical protein
MSLVSARFGRLIRYNLIGRILIILGSGYLVAIVTLYLFAAESYPAAFKALNPFRAPAPCEDLGFSPKDALRFLKTLPQDEVVEFDWRDWVDLSDVYDFSDQSSTSWMKFFTNPKLSLTDFNFPASKRAPEKEQAFVGKLYLDNVAPAPSRVILVGEARATYTVVSRWGRSHLDYGEIDDETEDFFEEDLERTDHLDEDCVNVVYHQINGTHSPTTDTQNKIINEVEAAVNKQKSATKVPTGDNKQELATKEAPTADMPPLVPALLGSLEDKVTVDLDPSLFSLHLHEMLDVMKTRPRHKLSMPR